MVGPEEIRRRAVRAWPEYLKSVVSGVSLFPLLIPFGKTSMGALDFEELRRQIQELRESRLGFTIGWAERVDRRWGRQQFPDRICFDNPAAYLFAIGKTEDARRFARNVDSTRTICPELEAWLAPNVARMEENAEIWPDILKVCRYFIDNPKPHRYVRELPVGVDTKFIERHETLLTRLLLYLIPDFVDASARSLDKKLGLLADQPLIRFRVLDPAVGRQLALRFSDLSIPVDDFARLAAENTSVVITENKMNFLTLPPLPNCIGIFGGGGAAALLSQCEWLKFCRIVYWGDIDPSGFAILSRFRHAFPQTTSVLMDDAVLMEFAHLAIASATRSVSEPDNLEPPELRAFQRVVEDRIMLEQEKLPVEKCRRALTSAISRGVSDTVRLDT